MSDDLTLFFFFFYLVIVLVLVFWPFIQRYLDKKYLPASSDSKDFKIDDPVAWLSADHKSIRYTYINWFDTFCSQFILETGDYSWSSELRHPTPEELEKYFRK